jgi:hypothetical protein
MNPKDLDAIEQHLKEAVGELDAMREHLAAKLATMPQIPTVANIDAWLEWDEGTVARIESFKPLLAEVGFLEGPNVPVALRQIAVDALDAADAILEISARERELMLRMRVTVAELERLTETLPRPDPKPEPGFDLGD